ncbi:MAG: glycosyl transferase [Bacteroidales bacterium]|nr:glycosyl transferase [Bacteroidales bacterium]
MAIPKVIHYCWFGRNPLPESAVKCMDSWKKFLPDCQIKEWNEDNFDVNAIPYTKDAYQAGKYAFVSDYARFWILFNYGGIYFDVDVEVVKPIDDLLEKGPIWAFEIDGTNGKKASLAGGLCLAAEKGNPFYKTILEEYLNLPFYDKEGKISSFTMNPLITRLFVEKGLRGDGSIEVIDGNYFYPAEYFNPLEPATGRLRKTANTRSIHWYMASWLPPQPKWKISLKRFVRRTLGEKNMNWLRKSLKTNSSEDEENIS